MSQESLTAADVANFLADNPDFFEQYAEIFASLKVPHPHKAQAISLGERQILTLRSRLKNHELQLQNLVYNASGNHKINSAVMQWCAQMLAQADPQLLPEMITSSLKDQFDLSAVDLQLWNLQEINTNNQFVSPELQEYTKSLSKPYCGVKPDQAAISWLDESAQSVAIIPLKSQAEQKTIGLLIFSSTDPQRFTNDMGTDFLELIAQLAGSALSRLL